MRVRAYWLCYLSLAGVLPFSRCAQLEKLQTYFPGSRELKTIEISPVTASVAAGTQRKFIATGIYNDGVKKDISSLVDWSVSGVDATLIDTGTFQGNTLGSGVVSAKLERISTQATIRVTAATVVSLTVTPANTYIPAGNTQQMTATAAFSDSTTVDVTTQATWSSDNTLVAQINTTGLATPQNQGATILRASFTQNTGTPITVNGSAAINVPAAGLVSIAITPTTVSLAKGSGMQLTATGTYTDNSTVNITSAATWASDSGNVSVTAGLIAANAVGNAKITATVGGVVSPEQIVSVTPATLQAITVTPGVALARGLTQQYTAIGHYSDGTQQNLTTDAGLVWSITGGTFGAGGISNTNPTQGLLTALSGTNIGLYSVVATHGGTISGSTTLTVTPANLTAITVNAPLASIAKGTAQQYTATGDYSDGTSAAVTSLVTWDIVPAAGTLPVISNATGTNGYLSTAAATTEQAVTVRASFAGIVGTKSLTVSPKVLSSIAVTSPDSSIPLGITEQYTATGTYSDGTQQNITADTSLVWSITGGAFGAGGISNSDPTRGLLSTFTGTNPGMYTVVATWGAVSGGKILSVTPAVLMGITVTPSPAFVAKGTSQQFAATGQYSDGTTPDITAMVTWSIDPVGGATPPAIGNTAGTKGFLTTNSLTTQDLFFVRAASGAVSGTGEVYIDPKAFIGLVITSDNIGVVRGVQEFFTATPIYSDGTNSPWPPGATLTWSVAETGLGSGFFANTGLPNTKYLITTSDTELKTYTVTASSNFGINASKQIFMMPPALTNIALSTWGLYYTAPGGKIQLNATASFTDGTSFSGNNLFQWASVIKPGSNSPAGGAVVDANGLVTAVKPGRYHITAQYGASTSAPLTLSVVQIALSGYHGCAVYNDDAKNTVGCWGDNSSGAVTAPALVSPTHVALGAGSENSCAIHNGGQLACWGAGFSGGVPPITNATQIDLAWNAGCALRSNGDLTCWGDDSKNHISGIPFGGNFTQLAMGYNFACATQNGPVACWGDGWSTEKDVPFPVPMNPKQLVAGKTNGGAGALLPNGTLTRWGNDFFGKMSGPATVTDIVELSVGSAHSCAIRANGSVQCWGQCSGWGECSVPGFLDHPTQIVAGNANNCVLMNQGIRCWGWNEYGQAPINPAIVSLPGFDPW